MCGLGKWVYTWIVKSSMRCIHTDFILEIRSFYFFIVSELQQCFYWTMQLPTRFDYVPLVVDMKNSNLYTYIWSEKHYIHYWFFFYWEKMHRILQNLVLIDCMHNNCRSDLSPHFYAWKNRKKSRGPLYMCYIRIEKVQYLSRVERLYQV